MSAYITIVVFCLTVLPASATDWEWVFPSPAQVRYPLLSLGIDHSVWAVGTNGEIIVSIDGGRSFDRLSSILIASENPPQELAIYSREIAVISFRDGTVIQTVDGGSSWHEFPLPAEYKVTSLCYAEDRTLWMACENRMVLQFMPESTTPVVDEALAGEPSINIIRSFGPVVLCGAKNAVWHRHASGSWSRYLMSEWQVSRGFAILEDNICVITADSIISLYPQFEKRFSLSAPGPASTLDGVNFVAVGWMSVYISTNSAASWTSVAGSPYPISKVIWTSDSTIVALTSHGLRLFSSDTGKTWTPSYDSIPRFDQFHILENGVMYARNSEHRYVHRSTDNGATWSLLGSTDLFSADDVLFVNDSVWYVRDGYAAQVTGDAGKTWKRTREWYKYFFKRVSGDTLYAHEFSNDHSWTYVFRSTNGGVAWDTIVKLNAFWRHAAFASGGVIILADGNRRFYRSRDNGTSWQEETHPAMKIIANDDNGLLWGGVGSYFYWVSTDQGETWGPSINAPDCSLPLTFGTSRYYSACRNTVLVSDDSGATWRSDSIPFKLFTLHLAPDGWMYSSLTNESLIRYRVGSPVSVSDGAVPRSAEPAHESTEVTCVYSLTGQLQKTILTSQLNSCLECDLPKGLWLCITKSRSGQVAATKLSVQ